MQLIIDVGDFRRTRIVFSRNWFTGHVAIKTNGDSATVVSPWDVSTHFTLRLTTEYQFTVGEPEPHRVVIVRRRPLLFAGLRPHHYRVFIDDRLVQERSGY